jgi:hypothetical protein
MPVMPSNIQYHGIYRNAGDAIKAASIWGDGCVPILTSIGYLVVDQDEADRLAFDGMYFAYVGLHAGRVVTVPVN